MGIKGIYRELGPGQRISLAKLAAEKLETSGRPLRLAIDVAIWQFQARAAKGGTNPAIRTLFYRLVRLLGLSVQPIFVFDGPYKPEFKRNKRSGRGGDCVSTAMAKRLIRIFGFPIHQAPGEAEAECALLQREGIVDAVLSEDVDTIMFGCTRTLRNWSAEGPRGGKTPTHVTMYDVDQSTMLTSGLGREGMIIVALMSGGDYIPEGVPRCGVKLACEVAKAGFGKSLCRIKAADKDSLAAWKASLERELFTNESGFFRTRHKSLNIPGDFPDMKILRYYTHPVVSNRDTIESLKRSLAWNTAVDAIALREFVAETFDWTYRIGAIKLIRVLSPGLLVQGLSSQRNLEDSSERTGAPELGRTSLIKGISGRRRHFSTDGTPELRVSYIPLDIVPLDLSGEMVEEISNGRQGLALNSDDEYEASQGGPDGFSNPEPANSKATFDPASSQSLWVPEVFVKLGAPSYVEDWEEKQKIKKQGATKAPKKPTKSSGRKGLKPTDSGADFNKPGALDDWVVQERVPVGQTTRNCLSRNDHRPQSLTSPWIATGGPAHFAPNSPPSSSRHLHQTARPLSKPSKPIPTSIEGAEDPTQRSGSRAIIGSQPPPRNNTSPRPFEAILISSSPETLPPLSSLLLGKSSQAQSSSKSMADRKVREAELSGRQKHASAVKGTTDGRLAHNPKRPLTILESRTTQTSITSFMSHLPNGTRATGTSISGSRRQPVSGKNEVSAATATLDQLLERLEISSSPPESNMNRISSSKLATGSTGTAVVQPHIPAPVHSGVRLLVPCINDEGFFDEMEVEQEEAEALITAGDGRRDIGRVRTHRRAWRQSAVSVIDLTGDD
ncbi:hypothetical protein SODALDRAFT_336741 [Sodiomyces alkalinus F11]|uniref:Flap structure-specific endonuclease n=1 Tax=Sodiomyces alkalinus (strain CBS 110278 / VKM F-3762 / F11) TaxID=1314773 RepID=A0A3N2Q9C5_SODAK|nr:hypothetical protein SODALDRAFT_336741 [Sodiomyces alkalinus F11]ROT43364.1 hypothetical protein SODALDRAFT_336741 [Sodiomyces alkalinus F11]